MKEANQKGKKTQVVKKRRASFDSDSENEDSEEDSSEEADSDYSDSDSE